MPSPSNAMDITRLRDETPGCAIVNHLNNAGSSLPTRRTLDATLDHLRLEAEIGGYEAADQAQERIEAFYPSAARLIGARPDEIAFIENTMDLATGTVMAKARMTNAAERLWPGAFVPARIVLGIDANAVTMPASALQIGQAGAFVYVVREGRAVVVPIKVARTVGEEVVVASGLNGGENVVPRGQLRLAEGLAVNVDAPRPPGGKPSAGKQPTEAKN